MRSDAQTSRPWLSTRGAPRLEVVGRAETRSQPKSVEVSPDGRHVWVANFGRPNSQNVFIYDADTLERVGEVTFEGNAVETAFSPDGTRAYVSNFRRGVVEVIDTQTFDVLHEIRVGANPKFMVVSPDGERLYVALYSRRRVAVVDLARREIIQMLPTGIQPRGMAMREDGTVLVASFRSDFVQHFDQEGREVRRFRTCRFPRHLQLGPDPDRLYVTCTLNRIGLYDVTSGRRLAMARTGRNPRTLGLSPDGRWAATANFHSSDITLADFENRTHQTSPVPGADQLVGLAIRLRGEELRIYATSWNNRTLFALEPRTPLQTSTDSTSGDVPTPNSAGTEPLSEPDAIKAPPVIVGLDVPQTHARTHTDRVPSSS